MTVDLVYDNLDSTGDEPILVTAMLSLLSTDDGGRATPIRDKLRPNHNFGSPENRLVFIGQIEIPDSESVYPGESCEVLVRFLNVRGLRENLTVGRVWRVQEGAKLIGTAEVLSVAVRDLRGHSA